MEVLKAENLSKQIGKTTILNNISFCMEGGQVYGLIGENGAGKTTLIRTLCGLMKPSEGNVVRYSKKSVVGYMPQSCRLEESQKVKDTLAFFTELKGDSLEKSISMCHMMHLDVSKKVKLLSPGQQKKLLLIIAMIGNPELYILDEPTAGLDPYAAFEMIHYLENLHKQGKAILISSHILQDLESICTNVLFLEKGNVICNEPMDVEKITKMIRMRYYFGRGGIDSEQNNEIIN